MYKGVGDIGCGRGGSRRRISVRVPGFVLIPQGTLDVSYTSEFVPTRDQGTGLSYVALQSVIGKTRPVGLQSPHAALWECGRCGREARAALGRLRWGRPAPQLAPPPCCSSSKAPGVSSLESPWGPRELPGALCLGDCDFFPNSIRSHWYFNSYLRMVSSGENLQQGQ